MGQIRPMADETGHRTTITLPAELTALIDEIRVLQRNRGVQLLPRGHKHNPAVIWLALERARQLKEELAAGPPRRRR